MIAVSQASAEQGYVVRGDNPWLILAIFAVIVLACVLASCRPRPRDPMRDLARRDRARSRSIR
jgi:hypothetical protein